MRPVERLHPAKLNRAPGFNGRHIIQWILRAQIHPELYTSVEETLVK